SASAALQGRHLSPVSAVICFGSLVSRIGLAGHHRPGSAALLKAQHCIMRRRHDVFERKRASTRRSEKISVVEKRR
ncbi:MAG: hypothetical protein KGQ48_14150, partial [Bradyrhizobium sp.]|nr:hypothetical protein [Bradyrhizobium sp.]